MKTAILYYTNNLLAPELLKNTLLSAIDHAKRNDCELIITSHFPITDSYVNSSLVEGEEKYKEVYNPEKGQKELLPVYKHLVKDMVIPIDPKFCKSYVVGKLPYHCVSIIRQILFSIQKSESDAIILMEHDCFYPHNYVEVVKNALGQFQAAYCNYSTTFLNQYGFFKINAALTLSTFSFLRDIANIVFETKERLLLANTKRLNFEPSLKGLPSTCQEDYSIEKALCIDTFLKDSGQLDIKHFLNQNGFISSWERTYMTGPLSDRKGIKTSDFHESTTLINGTPADKRAKGYFDQHSYWGNAEKYINMFKDHMEEAEKSRYVYGIEPY